MPSQTAYNISSLRTSLGIILNQVQDDAEGGGRQEGARYEGVLASAFFENAQEDAATDHGGTRQDPGVERLMIDHQADDGDQRQA